MKQKTTGKAMKAIVLKITKNDKKLNNKNA